MKRFVVIYLLPVAVLICHLLFYSTGCDLQNPLSDCLSEYVSDTVISDISCTDSNFYTFAERHSESENKESVETADTVSFLKKANAEVSCSTALSVLRCGKLLNGNTVWDFLSSVSLHMSGTPPLSQSFRC